MTTHRIRNCSATETNLATFCQELQCAFAAELTRSRVQLHCEVDTDLICEFPRTLVRQILSEWIEEALSEMPDGGELDISVVAGASGLEIEVADSRETDLHETREYWHRHLQIPTGKSNDLLTANELRLETSLCPQGGVARTVVIPAVHMATQGTSLPMSRKAA